ncbi:MAG: hypothetical protein GTO14_14710 [Anaerolineales bacterium]|nr:hypothetical protein [Anaerolineales bacterium]
MKSHNRHIYLLPVLLLLFAALACELPGQSAASDLDRAATETLQALATISAGTLQAIGDQEPEPTVPPPMEETPAPEATPTPTIVHVTWPDNPSGLSSFMTDRSTRALASERRAIADNFDWNLLERPYTAEVMDYKEHIDIIRGELDLSSPWVYVTIFLEGSPPETSEVMYAVEIDLDIDGRGDWFIGGLVPPSSEWTTDGVRAWRDSNNDVGGTIPLRSESPQPAWNGYDELVFDQGLGSDPDAAWIRRSPTHPDRVQLAFKHNLIGSDGSFMWGAWSDEGVKEAGWLDYNDHFTLDEAGSPAPGDYYPIMSLHLVDNTCRWGVGFTPDGTEPGVCFIPPTPTPTSPPPPTPTPTNTPIPPPK